MEFVRRTLRTLKADHPVFFWGGVMIVAVLLVATIVVGARIPAYQAQARALDSRMTEDERATRDRILNSQAKRSEMAIALLKRELALRSLEEDEVHIAIDSENGTLSVRHGPATLREVPVSIGSDSTITAPDGRSWRFVRAVGERHLVRKAVNPTITVPDWVFVGRGEPIPPESERQVEGALGQYVLTLDDGTEIYSTPEVGPFVGTVKPASIQASEEDLEAIFEAIREQTPVFIY